MIVTHFENGGTERVLSGDDFAAIEKMCAGALCIRTCRPDVHIGWCGKGCQNPSRQDQMMLLVEDSAQEKIMRQALFAKGYRFS